MKLFILLVALATLFDATWATHGPKDDPLPERIDLFVWEFWHHINFRQDNMAYSPLGVHLILSAFSQGAKGKTLYELQHLLKVNHMQDYNVHDLYRQLIVYLNNVTDVNIVMANELYHSPNISLLDSFVNSLHDFYDMGKPMTNDTSTKKLEKTIEDFETKKKISALKNLIPSYSQRPSDKSITLVNFFSFEGKWKHAFNPNMTERSYFDDVTVDFMQQVNKFEFKTIHVDDKELSIVRLPFLNENLSLYIILPNVTMDYLDFFDMFEANINLPFHFFNDLNETNVHLRLPKFNLTTVIHAKSVLHDMGMVVASTDHSDFTGISSDGVYLDDVSHATHIELTEAGLGVTTPTNASLDSASNNHVVFDANRPFLFYLVDHHSQVIILHGKYSIPNLKVVDIE